MASTTCKLANQLLALADENVRDASADTAKLDQALADAFESARRAWTDIDLPDEQFLAHIARHVNGDAVQWLKQTHTDDLYLACACANGHAAAIQALHRGCMADVQEMLSRLLPDRGLADEVAQAILQQLLAGSGTGPGVMASYSGRGRLRGWLRVMATREALRVRKANNRERPREEIHADTELVELDNPELRYMKQMYREEFRAAFAQALKSLQPRERTLLRYAFLDGLTVDEIGAIYRVHRASAARWVAAAREQLAQATREHFMARLHVGVPEQESILRFIESQIDISVRRYMDEAG